jgi:hypothetical protein
LLILSSSFLIFACSCHAAANKSAEAFCYAFLSAFSYSRASAIYFYATPSS